MSSPAIQHISECFIKLQHPIEESNQICYLAPGDIAMLSAHYIQKGLLFNKNQQFCINNLLDKLKQSLSLALVHFYPLSGRLVTRKTEDPPTYVTFVDCSSNSPGGGFIYATLDMTVSDILSPIDVPPIVQSLFDLHKAVNHDGHTMPLLSIQVTELLDGVFIGCSMNHSIGDGTSYWNFFNTWSEIFQSQGQGHDHDILISHQPIHNRWFPESCDPLINLPFKHHDEFISRFETPKLRERIFHFTAESIAKLKAKANKESKTTKISSFQSLSALVWTSITRARNLPHDQVCSCKLAANSRTRMEPPMAQEYFGNLVQLVSAGTTIRELLEHNLGWAAWKVHLAVANHNNTMVQLSFNEWLLSPVVYQIARNFDSNSVLISSSPRFNMYGNEFGMGKAVAVRSGYANKYDGKVTSYPGHEGGGSVDLEVCLMPDTMGALELDQEFMTAVSVSNPL
ncbi:hypothetical protein Lal_00004559 [Lupinus albus]|uniref:Putative shikimate O-hydroxycinnamoyltransferase n=1 Tax=Lupinus albus TaxID=3870 RepID=A0A6A5M2F9_LUPAL|nr:putative shikimate O-hydroxycinnamoyltransferase [Lupinus albus]KAF1865185.1 hypothetical protein Lal_00004559 [Lupinus albus]